MSLPLVSVVIPSYKSGNFEKALRSAVGQSYPRIEIIVSDNCPTEEIRAICENYNGIIYQRSYAFRLENISAAFFSGKGEFIKPLFDDDILHPFCVERMVEAMLSNDAVAMTYSASSVIDRNNKKTQLRRPFSASGTMSGLDLHRSILLNFNNHVGECTSVMFRRSTLWNIGSKGLFSYRNLNFYLGLADVALYINLTKDGLAYYIDEELSYFRRDLSLKSNTTNIDDPGFGFTGSDWIDLLISSHIAGIVTDAEVLAARPTIDIIHDAYSSFKQVLESYSHYQTHSKTILNKVRNE